MCLTCKGGTDYSKCIIPKCNKCFYNTSCQCDIRTQSCLCVDCGNIYAVPLCQMCKVRPSNVATAWSKCLTCLEVNRRNEYTTLIDSSLFGTKDLTNSVNIANATSKCYLCRDGRDLTSCITPKFSEEVPGKFMCDTQGNPLVGSKWHSSKIMCINCKGIYNRPTCVICSRLGEPYSAYKYCSECSFFSSQVKQERIDDPKEAPITTKRQIFVANAPMFKTGFVYAGEHANNGCGLCYDGRFSKAMIIKEFMHTSALTCMFCNISV
jgi:hypothetical protein